MNIAARQSVNGYLGIREWLYFTSNDTAGYTYELRVDACTGDIDAYHKSAGWLWIYRAGIDVNVGVFSAWKAWLPDAVNDVYAA